MITRGARGLLLAVIAATLADRVASARALPERPPARLTDGPSADTVPDTFIRQLDSLCWVAYAPTQWNPDKDVIPSAASIRRDLAVLRRAGFDGLVTYEANTRIVRVAAQMGFAAIVVGVWDPMSRAESDRAIAMASMPAVVGYSVGNEGLDVRYGFDTLSRAIDALRAATRKPVTATEQIEDYADPKVVALGDWLFPNVHPYFHALTEPKYAVMWTLDRFDVVSARSPKPVLFKEVGLPSGGDPRVSESVQADYYRRLSDTHARFVWFEAFDELWKNAAPVEPHWGLFRADRSPKPVASLACRDARRARLRQSCSHARAAR